MGILFLVALVLVWPTAGLSIIAYIALIIARAIFQAKDRMHHADNIRAQREVQSGGTRLPSWMAHRDKIEEFVYGVQNTAEHRGVPKLFSAMIMNDQDVMKMLMYYAGSMEAEGASFIEQQMAVMEKLVDLYNTPSYNNESAKRGSGAIAPHFNRNAQQIKVLRLWLENETSWHPRNQITDEELTKSKTLILGDAVSGEFRHPKVSYVPNEILLMKKLEDFHLQLNELDTLPPVICNISSLKKLRLGGNSLTSLPREIGRMRNLELLTLWSNNLSALPEEIGELVNLKALNIAYNENLTSLPSSIVNLEKIEEFDWYGPGEKFLTGQQEAWLRDLRAKGSKICLDNESFLDA